MGFHSPIIIHTICFSGAPPPTTPAAHLLAFSSRRVDCARVLVAYIWHLGFLLNIITLLDSVCGLDHVLRKRSCADHNSTTKQFGFCPFWPVSYTCVYVVYHCRFLPFHPSPHPASRRFCVELELLISVHAMLARSWNCPRTLVCTFTLRILTLAPQTNKKLIVLRWMINEAVWSAFALTHSSFLSNLAARALQKVVARKWLARLL